MDMVDLDLLRYCTDRGQWEEVKDGIAKSMCVKESWLLFGDMGKYYEEFPEANSITARDFKTWFRIKAHPDYKREQHELYGTIIDNVFSTEMPDSAVFRSTIRAIAVRSVLDKARDELEDGRIDVDELLARVSSSIEKDHNEETRTVSELIDIDELASHARKGGLYWRLEDLNKSIGPISKGDFVIVAKRPEVGGTSFLCSELTFMLEQLPPGGKAVIFNNEEEPHKVKGRIVSTALGTNHMDIVTNPGKAKKEFSAWLGDKEVRLVHDTQMTIQSVKRRLDELQPDIIGINVLLKVGGTGKKEDHDKFQELGERFRGMAQEYAPILAVVQADPSAEGERFPSQDRIYKSKTALQGEADALIMMGTDDPIVDTVRYIYVAKNKIPPSMCTETRSKHIKSEVKFDIDTGRFTSCNFSKHSKGKGYVYRGSVRSGDDSGRGSEGGQPGSTLAKEQSTDGGVDSN